MINPWLSHRPGLCRPDPHPADRRAHRARPRPARALGAQASWRMEARRRPPRSHRDPDRAGQIAPARPAARALRPNEGDALHLPARRGCRDGGRSRGHAGERPDGAGRRRLPLSQLRRLRHARTPARLRHQRFRRDRGGAVGMGSQAPGHEFRRRHARRAGQGGAHRARRDRGAQLPRRPWRRSPPCRCSTPGTGAEHRRRGHSRSDRHRRAGPCARRPPRGRIPSRSPRSAIAPAPPRASTTIPRTASITRRPPMPPPSAPPSRRDWWTTPNRLRPSAARCCSAIAWPTRPTRWSGVGAVGTLCGVLLMVSGDGESLYLQFKEATRSVLEAHAGPSPYAITANGWCAASGCCRPRATCCWASPPGRPAGTSMSASCATPRSSRSSRSCRRAISAAMPRPAARCWRAPMPASADAVVLSAYLGKSAAFDEAIGAFAHGLCQADRSGPCGPAGGHRSRPIARPARRDS